MQIVHIPETQMQISIMSNGKDDWVVIEDASGAWITNWKVTKQEVKSLRELGMEYNVDPDMSHPDDPNSY